MELENIPMPPDEKCAICLQILGKTKSYTSQCFHQFCFECLIQWSAIKLSCPLCKTPFDRILFNIKSCAQYKQFDVKPINPPTTISSSVEIINMPSSLETQTYQEVKNSNVSKASWLVNSEQAPLEFRILVYVNKWYSCPNQICYQLKITNLISEFNSNDTSTQKNDESGVSSRSILTDIQNRIESDLLYSISYRQVKSFRNTKPEFYRHNIACTHRLIQFIYRELKAIACVMSSSKLPNSSGIYLDQTTRQKLIQLIITELKRHSAKSDEFLAFLSEYIRPIELCKHFAHELYVYCGSTSNSLLDYDAKCVYYSTLEAANREFNTHVNKLPILPLPILLNKYRLNIKANQAQQQSQADRIEEHILINDDIGDAPTPDYNYVESETENESVDSSSDSDQSSYCEYVEPSPKRSPEYIVLYSSSESDHSRTRQTSKRSSSRRRSASRENVKKKKKRTSRSRSLSRETHIEIKNENETDTVIPGTSRKSRSRKKEKSKHKKKSKHKHKSKSKRKDKKKKSRSHS